MLINGLQALLTTPISPGSGQRHSYFFWLGLSLAVSLGYAFLALEEPLSQPYVVQDDARQYLFWMQRSLDPSLFPNDLIAHYFQSVTPLGYKALYRGAIAVGIHPFQFNIMLPALLGLIATQYLFRLTFTILPIPFTAWMASVMFNQTLWMKDDLVSATPRAFVYPLFLAFLFYWVKFDQVQESGSTPAFPTVYGRRGIEGGKKNNLKFIISACVVSLGLLGLFYPQYVLLAGAMLGIAMIADGTLMNGMRRMLTSSKSDPSKPNASTWFYLSTAATILIVIGYYATTSSVYGPVVTWEQARAMPEFWPGGRNFFFSHNLGWFYGVGDRSGFLHVGLVRPATLVLGIVLPLILRIPKRFPLINAITPAIYRLGHLLLAATTLFIAAHGLLFRLHLPSRYTDHSLRMIMAIASALVLTLLLDTLFNQCRFLKAAGSRADRETGFDVSATRLRCSGSRQSSRTYAEIQNRSPSGAAEPTTERSRRRLKSKIQNLKFPILVLVFTLFIFILLLAYPQFVDPFPLTKYKVGRFPDTYAYLRAQPKDTLVASVAKEADNIPIFAQRSILIGHEYAIPYHTGYYDEFRRRAIALLNAQYTTDKQELARFIEGYGIDLWLIEEDAYNNSYFKDHWIRQYATTAGLILDNATSSQFSKPVKEDSTKRPLLQRFQSKCTVLREGKLKLINTECVLERMF